MISVIVPTHNRRELLERKLQALEGQPGALEVVVVADGCTDDTAQFLREYRPSYALKVLETAESYGKGKGAAFARNRGAEAASGDLLVFSDDDVVPGPGWLEAHRAAHARPDTVAVGRLTLPPHLGQGVSFGGPRVFWWNATGANTSLPRALFGRAGGYDEGFAGYGGEDPDLGYRLSRAGARFVFARDAAAEHWDEGYARHLLAKARKAGAAHMQVWLKHRDPRIAWALGIHPALLSVKMALIPGFKFALGTRTDGELAYCWGAWEAYEAHRDGGA